MVLSRLAATVWVHVVVIVDAPLVVHLLCSLLRVILTASCAFEVVHCLLV